LNKKFLVWHTILCAALRYKGKDFITMATLTITYDGRNKVARNVVELIRSLDVFHISKPQTDETEWTAEQEREAFLYTSKMNAANIFADKL
jgi:hypothetical protein